MKQQGQEQQPPASPDWRSRPVLPPIQSNTTPQRSQTNTQYNKHTNNSNNDHQSVDLTDSYKQSYQSHHYDSQALYQSTSHQPSPSNQPQPAYSPRDYSNHDTPRDHQWKPAAGYSYLPNQPIALSKDQEIFLMQKLAADLAGASLDQVKAVYEEMAANARTLTGMGSYTDLGLALQKHGVRLYKIIIHVHKGHVPHFSE